MLIRSQDKKNIINMDNICHFSIRAKETHIYEINVLENSGLIISIAEYSTEEKAITVLDMIEQYYREYSSGNCNDCSVFQMPEDVIIVNEMEVNG